MCIMKPVFIIIEIGINHNGNLNTARQLIDGAVEAGANAVKFQKRTIDRVYEKEYLDSPRESPWGITQRVQKEGLEFGLDEYKEIDEYCRIKDIPWFASAWDMGSLGFLDQFDLPYNKVASAMLMHSEVIPAIAKQGKYTFISTGMSTLGEIKATVRIFRDANCPFELMHCDSTYPMKDADANLRTIKMLRDTFQCDVGYSGHEVGIIIAVAAAVLGATSIERHITLDRAMYGSDQAASMEVKGIKQLITYIRAVESGMGDGIKRITDEEMKVRTKLRRYDDIKP